MQRRRRQERQTGIAESRAHRLLIIYIVHGWVLILLSSATSVRLYEWDPRGSFKIFDI